jgi:hypothetical protein
MLNRLLPDDWLLLYIGRWHLLVAIFFVHSQWTANA